MILKRVILQLILRRDETLLLIDCGETVFKKILEKELIEGVKDKF